MWRRSRLWCSWRCCGCSCLCRGALRLLLTHREHLDVLTNLERALSPSILMLLGQEVILLSGLLLSIAFFVSLLTFFDFGEARVSARAV